MAVDTRKKNSPDAIDVVKLVNDCINQINEGEKLLGHVNIIIAGKTDVGKNCNDDANNKYLQFKSPAQ